MRGILVVIVIAGFFMACGSGREGATEADSTVTSTTPPAKEDTNAIGIMMGDTSIPINDSLKK